MRNSLAGLTLLAASASAQMPATWGYSLELAWDGTTLGYGRLITKMLACEVTRDLRTDVVAQGGDSAQRLLLLNGLSTNEGHLVLVGSGVKDFDVTPPSVGGHQDVAYLASSGLRRVSTSFHPTTLELVVADDLVWSGTSWPGARLVRAGRLDAGTGDDYVALTANSRTVLILIDGTTASSFLPGPRIYDVVLGNFTGDAKQEIALLTETDLTFVDFTGTVLASVSGTRYDADRIARIHNTASGLDAIAWMTRPDLDTTTTLRAVTVAGGVVSTRTFANTEFTALSSADADLDGRGDLLLARADASDPVYLKNTGTGTAPSFTGTAVDPLGSFTFSAPLVNAAAPVFADLSRNRRPEIVVAKCTTQESIFHVFAGLPNGAFLDEWPAPMPGQNPPTFPGTGVLEGVTDMCGEPGVLVDEYGNGTFLFHASNPPEDANFLEVRVWRRHWASGYELYTYPYCVSRTAHLRTETGTEGLWFVEGVPMTPLLAAVTDPAVPENSIVWFDVRWIQATDPGSGEDVTEVLQSWESFTVVGYTCAGSVCAVLPASFDSNQNYRVEAVTSELSAPTCTEDPDCPEGEVSNTCALPDGSQPIDFITIYRRPPPPPGTAAALQATLTRGPDMVPYEP